MKFVMISISPGIIRVAIKSAKTIFLPGSFSLENAKAERIEVMTTHTVVSTVMMMVFIKYLPKGAADQAVLKFLN